MGDGNSSTVVAGSYSGSAAASVAEYVIRRASDSTGACTPVLLLFSSFGCLMTCTWQGSDTRGTADASPIGVRQS